MDYRVHKFEIGHDDAGRRLDRILRALLPAMPLSLIYRLLRDGGVRVAGKRTDGAYRTKEGETLEIRVADTPENAAYIRGAAVAPAPIDEARRFASMILVETPDLAIVNKPRGVLTHGSGGIDEAAKAYFADRIASSLAFIPAPLHRLDRNTSGAVVVSASMAGARAFSAALHDGRIDKSYLALLGGDLATEELWLDELSRDAETRVSAVAPSGLRAEARALPLLRKNGFTLALIRLETGRTHQIRAQAASRGLALAGDSKYGGRPFPGGYILHCAAVEMPPGIGSPEALRVEAPLPPHAALALAELFGDDFESRLIITGHGGTLEH